MYLMQILFHGTCINKCVLISSSEQKLKHVYTRYHRMNAAAMVIRILSSGGGTQPATAKIYFLVSFVDHVLVRGQQFVSVTHELHFDIIATTEASTKGEKITPFCVNEKR